MAEKKVNVRELINKYQQNCERIGEIADACEKEKRDRTDAETSEYEALKRENDMLRMKMEAATAEHLRENPNAREEATKIIRENASHGQRTEIIMMRDLMMVKDVRNGALVPLNIQDILKGFVASGGTVILSSHVMDLVQRLCDHVAIMDEGRILAAGTVDEVRGESTLEERFIQLVGGRTTSEGLSWLRTSSY